MRPSKAVDQMRGGFRHRHDVVDDRLRRIAEAESGARLRPGRGAELFGIAEHADRLRAMAAKVCGSVCAAQPVTTICARRPLAAQRADRLPRLAHRFGGDGAGVDHDGVAQAGALGFAADHFRFGGVEPAAEGDDFDAHDVTPPAAGEQRRIETAVVLVFDRPGHQHMVVALAPFDREVAARHRHRHLAARCAAAAPPRPPPRRPPSRTPW